MFDVFFVLRSFFIYKNIIDLKTIYNVTKLFSLICEWYCQLARSLMETFYGRSIVLFEFLMSLKLGHKNPIVNSAPQHGDRSLTVLN